VASGINNFLVTEEDFTFEAIELAYGDILGVTLQNYKKPLTPTNSPRTTKEEAKLDFFWNQCEAPGHSAGRTS
jgi:hypothetical protein